MGIMLKKSHKSQVPHLCHKAFATEVVEDLVSYATVDEAAGPQWIIHGGSRDPMAMWGREISRVDGMKKCVLHYQIICLFVYLCSNIKSLSIYQNYIHHPS